MKIGPGAGLVICVLVPVVLRLFGIIGTIQTASGILLLGGLWAVLYGVMFANVRDRLYDVGAGIVVVAISTFLFLPLQYVLGLVLLSVIVLVVTSVVTAGKKGSPRPRN
jgi:hypothetical protein